MKEALFDREEGYEGIMHSNEVREIVDKQGYDVIFPADNELQIDIDTEEQYQIFLSQMKILENYSLTGAYEVIVTPSSSGLPHRHIVVRDKVEPDYFKNQYKRIAFQAALGSDPRRELLNLMGYEAGDDTPVLFIKKRETVKPELTGVKNNG